MTTDKLVQIATNPLGLAGLALFLVFSVMSRNQKMPAWWPKVSASLAAFALLGGLGMAYVQVVGPNKVETKGDCSPAMANVTVSGSVENNCNSTKESDKTVKGGSSTDKPTATEANSVPNPSAGKTVETKGNNSPAFSGVSVGGSIKLESNSGAGAKVSEDRSGEAKP